MIRRGHETEPYQSKLKYVMWNTQGHGVWGGEQLIVYTIRKGPSEPVCLGTEMQKSTWGGLPKV